MSGFEDMFASFFTRPETGTPAAALTREWGRAAQMFTRQGHHHEARQASKTAAALAKVAVR